LPGAEVLREPQLRVYRKHLDADEVIVEYIHDPLMVLQAE